MSQSKQSQINIAASQVRHLLFEATVLRNVVDNYRVGGDGDDDGVEIGVLESIVAEKLCSAWDGVEFIEDRSKQQKRRTKKSKKPAIVKAAA